jgi:small-conductance mechanosensitive channel
MVLLLLAPPNTPHHHSFHAYLQGIWSSWLDGFQDFISHDLQKLVFVIVITWILFWLINLATTRISRLAERHATGLGRASQIKTLASVLRATGIGIIGFIAALQVLRDVFDFNLAPLLASAGVAGVAIGLAAQTVVKDVINGMLILVEDQYNVGDVITIAGLTGIVDAMSLRKTTVRGFDGTLYLVPNSQITTVANQSRDFSSSTLNISVDFSADPDKVIAMLKKITMEVRRDPAYKNIFLDDPQVAGVDSIKGSEVIYPIYIKTRARTQYDALRDMLKRIHDAMEQEDILPGSPYRVTGLNTLPHPGEQPQPPAQPHPTANKVPDVNPFTGEGL